MAKLRLGIDATGASQGAAEYSRATNKIKSDSRKATTAVKKTSKSFKGLGGAAAGVKTLLLSFGAGFGLIGLVRTVSGFEKNMSAVEAVTRATEEQFKNLRDTAKELGSTTRFSASEAAAGMQFLGQAGFETQAILDSAADTLSLAAAGSLELARAADIASNVISGFNLEASEMGRVSDVMAETASSSNTNIEQLGQALSIAAPAAAALGVTVEETAAAIGILGNAGIQSGKAGTSLRTMLVNLIAPTDDAKAALKNLGLDMADIDVRSNGLIGVFKKLAEGNLDLESAVSIFGTRFATMGIILKEQISGFEDLEKKLQQSEGRARSMADTMEDNLGGALTRVSSAFEALTISTGDKGASGAIRELSEGFAIYLRRLSGSTDATAGAKQQFIEMADSIQVVIATVGTLIAIGLAAKLVAMAGAVKALSIALATSPLGLLAVAAAAATAAFVSLSDKTDSAAKSQKEYERALKESNNTIDEAIDKSKTLARTKVLETIAAKESAQELIKNSITKIQEDIAGDRQPPGFLQLGKLRDLGKAYGLLSTEIEKLKKGSEAAGKAFGGGGEGGGGGSGGGGLAKGLTDTQKAAKDLIDDLKIENAQLALLTIATKKGKEAVQEANIQIALEIILREEGIDAKSAEAVELHKLISANTQLKDALDEAENSQKKVNKVASEAPQIYKNAATGIQNAFTATFRQILDEGIDSFKTLSDRLLDVFKGMLAEMATLAIARPIIIPMVTTLGGALGVSSAAQASVLTQLGVSGAGGAGGAALAGGGAGGAVTAGGLGAGATLGLAGAGVLGGTYFSGGFDSTAGTAGGLLGGGAGAYGGMLLASSTGIGALAIPIGALLGSFLGGSIGGLFGGGNDKTKLGFSNVAEGSGVFGGIDINKSRNIDAGAVVAGLQSIDDTLAALLSTSQIERVSGALSGTGEFFSVNKFDNEIFDVVKNRLVNVINAVAENEVASKLLDSVARGEGNVDELVQAGQQIIGFINLFEEPVELNAAEESLRKLNEEFDSLADIATKIGFSVSEVEKRREESLLKLVSDFNTSIQDQILAFTDPLTLAMRAIEDVAKERLNNALSLGADLVEVEKLNALERKQVLERFGEEAKLSFDSISKFLVDITSGASSPLNAQEVLTNAQSQFDKVLGLARGGDQSAINNLPGAASNLLGAAQSNFGSTEDFFTLFNFVKSTLNNFVSQGTSDQNVGAAVVSAGAATVDELRELRAEVTRLITVTEQQQATLNTLLSAPVSGVN